MKAKTAIKKFVRTDREIFLQSKKSSDFISVNSNFLLEINDVILNAKVDHIETENPDAVTIYI